MVNGIDHAQRMLLELEKVNPQATNRIRHLATLEPDWDGDGGDPMAPEAMGTTAWILLTTRALTPAGVPEPFVAPLPDGGLQVDWESPSGAELMLVVQPNGTVIEFLLDTPTESGGLEGTEGIVSEDATLSELMARLG